MFQSQYPSIRLLSFPYYTPPPPICTLARKHSHFRPVSDNGLSIVGMSLYHGIPRHEGERGVEVEVRKQFASFYISGLSAQQKNPPSSQPTLLPLSSPPSSPASPSIPNLTLTHTPFKISKKKPEQFQNARNSALP